MTVLGIRINPTITRYALVKSVDGRCVLLNSEAESKLEYPSDMNTPESKVDWLYRELDQIIIENPDIKKVCVKINEYTRGENKSKRETSYLVGATLLCCYQKSIPVNMKIYRSIGIGINNTNVVTHAEEQVGSRAKGWDTKIADAIVAACSELQNSA